MALCASPATGRVVALRRTIFYNSSVGFPKHSVPTAHPNPCIRTGALGTLMNLSSRFARVVKSYVDSILSSFENPVKIIERTVFETNDDLIKMCRASAKVLASQKRLENELEAALQASEDWYHRAQLALEKGDENLAREALKRRKYFADNATALKTQLDQQKKLVDIFVSNTMLLETRLQDARSEKDTLKAPAQSAKAVMSEMLENLNTSSALEKMEEEKVMMMESQVNQLTSDDLEGKFGYLESSVDDDLANLKKEMSGTAVVRKELPPGKPS